MRYILSFVLALLVCDSAFSKKTGITETKTPLILLSIDGFAFDYLTTYQPKNILDFEKAGTSAKLLPIYPSKTFPNHLSIITGVYPEKHGIIHNTFYHPYLNKDYYKGAGKNNSAWVTATPFWSIAEDNNITSAVYFWPESEMKNQSTPPRYNIPYNNQDTDKARFDQIINWLKLPDDKAPQFIVSYFSSVDSAGHKFGPNSAEVAKAVKNIDNLFGNFIKRIQKEIPHKANIILVSDHGMVQVDTKKSITHSMIFSEKISTLIDEKVIMVAQSDTQLYLYFKTNTLTEHQQKSIFQELVTKQKYNTHLYRVYEKYHYPKHWQFNNNLVITPDVIIEAKPPAIFSNKQKVYSSLGTHGYDALNQTVLASIFIASGPNINEGRVVQPFENIHLVPFMSQLLGIKQQENIDGKKAVLTPLIKFN